MCTGGVLRRGEKVFCNNPASHPLFDSEIDQPWTGLPPASLMCVPLISKEGLFGVISCCKKFLKKNEVEIATGTELASSIPRTGSFSTLDVDTFEEIARQSQLLLVQVRVK